MRRRAILLSSTQGGIALKISKWEAPLLILPAVALLILVMVLPMCMNVYYGFRNLDYMNDAGFVGLKNFRYILNNRNFLPSLGTTLLVSLLAMAISMILGTLLALWTDRKEGMTAYSIELIGLIPWVISMVVAAMLWRWIFNGEFGLMNYVLSLFGKEPVNIFATREGAVGTLTFVMAWRTIGYSMLLVLAGLKGLSKDLIEAGAVDGANSRQIFWRIKFPLLKTPVLISSIVITMSNFNNNTVPLVLTGGGPGNATNVLTLWMHKIGFEYFQFGRASALSVLIFVINVILVVIYVKAVNYKID